MSLLSAFRGAICFGSKGSQTSTAGRSCCKLSNLFYPLEELADWPDRDRQSRLVFITRTIVKEEIERTLDGLDLNMPPPNQALPIDAEAFRRFSDAAGSFHAQLRRRPR
jgi:hypothetical protein